MNKKFFNLLMMAVALVTMVSFTSCGDDEPDDNGGNTSAIVGEWRMTYIKSWATDNGQIISESEGDRTDDDSRIVFNSDGTWYRTDNGQDFATGTYEVKGDQIYYTFNGHTLSGPYSINGDVLKMTLKETFTVDGVPFEYCNEETYKRVK